jgi:hypothetical protein
MSQTLQLTTAQAGVPALAANSSITNALAGQSVEYFGSKAGILTLYANADAVGVQHTLFLNDGQDIKTVIPPGSSLSIASTTGKLKTNEDFIGQWPVPAGIRLVWGLVNTTGAAIVARGMFVIS